MTYTVILNIYNDSIYLAKYAISDIIDTVY